MICQMFRAKLNLIIIYFHFNIAADAKADAAKAKEAAKKAKEEAAQAKADQAEIDAEKG